MKLTQKERILAELEKGGWLSNGYINRTMWITRGPARIAELRAEGYVIETADETDEHGFAMYRLRPNEILF